MGSFHARALNDMAGVTVAALCDPPKPDIDELAHRLDAPVVADPAVLIAGSGTDAVDAIVIASPDETHAALAVAAVEAGRPVLCEKPLATTVADAAAVVAAEEAAGRRLLQLGFMRPYDRAHQQLAEAVAELGAVHHVRCTHTNTAAASRPIEVIVGQSMVHDVHTVRSLTGADFTSVWGHATADESGHPRHVLVMAELSNGGHATLEFEDNAFAYDVAVEVTADRGIAATGKQLAAEVRRDGHHRMEIGFDWFARFDQAYRSELSAWVEAARHGGATGPSAVDGLAAQQVVAAIVESIKGHRPVSL